MRLFIPRRARMGQTGPRRERVEGFFSEIREKNSAALVLAAGIAYQFSAGVIGGKVIKARLGERSTQMIALAIGRGEPAMVGCGHGQAGDQLLLVGVFGVGAGNGPGRLAVPALMSLAKLVAVAAPGHIAEITAVVADDMNICAIAADEPLDVAGWIGGIAVIFLDQEVAKVFFVR